MAENKAPGRRIVELIVLVTLVACVTLVLFELASNLRVELLRLGLV